MILRFIYVNLSPSNVLPSNIKPSLLYNSKHVTYVLHHESGDGADGVDVVFGVVREVDAGYQFQVFENCVETLTGTCMQVAQWCISINEQDGLIGGGVGHIRVIAERFIHRHK
jgi:hypothetical protein